jgi:hypothetical protein
MNYTSEKLNDIRNRITDIRSEIKQLGFDKVLMYDRFSCVEGLLTCGIVTLYNSIEELRRFEIECDDEKFGKSYRFASRGIGLDSGMSCFVCDCKFRDDKNGSPLLNNIAGMVKSKEEGEIIASWFGGNARLDYRPTEPYWIQVKIGACDDHIENLRALDKITLVHNVIRQRDIERAASIK